MTAPRGFLNFGDQLRTFTTNRRNGPISNGINSLIFSERSPSTSMEDSSKTEI